MEENRVCGGSLLEKGSVIIGCGRKLHVPERNELRKLMLGTAAGRAEDAQGRGRPGEGPTSGRQAGSGLRRAPWPKAGSDF